MEFINMFDKFINERVAKAIEDQAKIHERDAERIATLERRLSQIDNDLLGLDVQTDDLDERLYDVSHTLDDRITELEEMDSDAQVKVRRYIREYFDSARIKVTIDKEVI